MIPSLIGLAALVPAVPSAALSRDRYADVIPCGHVRDVVFADLRDKVSRDCERIRRG